MDLFDAPVRYLITPGDARDQNFRDKKEEIVTKLEQAVDAGIELFQLREKRLSGARLYDLAVAARKSAKGSRTKILVNDRFDIAIAAGIDGVQLRGDSIPAKIIRKYSPDGFLIGVSIHDDLPSEMAKLSGADFALLGPVFSTPGKGNGFGLQRLSEILQLMNGFPVLAIGGINETNFDSVLRAGASGYGAIRYLNDVVRINR